MVSASCSTTITLLPRSRSRRSVAIRRRLSRWCRPIDGSSSTYITPDSSDPSCDASRMRCASPPDSVAAARVDLFQDLAGDLRARALEPQVGEVAARFADGHGADVDDALFGQHDRA